MQQNNNESGNAVVFILLGVVLFGTLIFTFTKSGQQGISNVTKQQAKLIASDMINYAKTMERAVNKLRANGCSESELNFYNTVVAGYSNSNAPGDESCHLFSASGGKMSWQSPPSGANDGTEWIITARNVVEDIGSNSLGDLIIMLTDLNSSVCDAVRDYSGYTTIGSDPGVSFNQFTGTYLVSDTLNFADGQAFNCINYDNAGTDEPFFYYTILER